MIDQAMLISAIQDVRAALTIHQLQHGQRVALREPLAGHQATALIGHLPALFPEWLGDRGFAARHGLRFGYVVGEMARGISSIAVVAAAARMGALGFFGAAGLAPTEVEAAIEALRLGPDTANRPWGVNLIHTPEAPALEEALVDLLLRSSVRIVCASAFLRLTPAAVRYAATGLRRQTDGTITRQNRLFAKVSRPEVAAAFLSPAPEAMLRDLVASNRLSAEEATLAAQLPLAEDVTAEADSGGHTDGRPLLVLLPELAQLRDQIAARHAYATIPRIGAAGGLGTPMAVAAAFALGAAYVVTGSVNQSAVESGLSDEAKAMLHTLAATDVGMAPCADMFEMGVQVQVVRRGTLYATRAAKLYSAYRAYPSLDALPHDLKAEIEREIFRMPIAQVRAETERYFNLRDPRLLEVAASQPKLIMALVFRWYLGLSSRWPLEGRTDRKADFQIWCGPAMGAFNSWAKGTFLENPEQRTVEQIALNFLEGAAMITRAQTLRSFGVEVPPAAFMPRPRRLAVGAP